MAQGPREQKRGMQIPGHFQSCCGIDIVLTNGTPYISAKHTRLLCDGNGRILSALDQWASSIGIPVGPVHELY